MTAKHLQEGEEIGTVIYRYEVATSFLLIGFTATELVDKDLETLKQIKIYTLRFDPVQAVR